jgi:ABC-2 type transport system permease protein
MMLGIGMIFSGLTIWQKNIGQSLPLIQGITLLFSGVYYPIQQLPEVLQPISKIIPFYYSVEGLRLSLIPNTSSEEMLQIIIILTVLTIAFLIIGVFAIKMGLKNAKKQGSLAFY